MIKIVAGVYGYLDKNGIVKPKTTKDDPFELTEEQEARLVGLGVAVYVNDFVNGAESKPKNDGDRWTLIRAELAEMTVTQLKKLAEDADIDTSKLKKKADLIDALSTDAIIHDSEKDGIEDRDEDVPNFDPAEAVK